MREELVEEVPGEAREEAVGLFVGGGGEEVHVWADQTGVDEGERLDDHYRVHNKKLARERMLDQQQHRCSDDAE